MPSTLHNDNDTTADEMSRGAIYISMATFKVNRSGIGSMSAILIGSKASTRHVLRKLRTFTC